MRIGDIIALPVNPSAKEHDRVYADARVKALPGEFIEFEFIAGPKDGALWACARDYLDELLGREGGEEWKGGKA